MSPRELRMRTNRSTGRRTPNYALKAWTAAWCDPPEATKCAHFSFLSFFLSLSTASRANRWKKTEHSVERFLKSESATTSCSLVERIARTSGPAICRASNSNDYICSRFKGTGQTLIEFERRPTKRSIRVCLSRRASYLCLMMLLLSLFRTRLSLWK